MHGTYLCPRYAYVSFAISGIKKLKITCSTFLGTWISYKIHQKKHIILLMRKYHEIVTFIMYMIHAKKLLKWKLRESTLPLFVLVCKTTTICSLCIYLPFPWSLFTTHQVMHNFTFHYCYSNLVLEILGLIGTLELMLLLFTTDREILRLIVLKETILNV